MRSLEHVKLIHRTFCTATSIYIDVQKASSQACRSYMFGLKENDVLNMLAELPYL